MNDYTLRNIVLIIYLITIIYFYSIYTLIYIDKKWKDIKCSPLVMLANNIVNYEDNSNILQKCLGNIQQDVYNDLTNTYNSKMDSIDNEVDTIYQDNQTFKKNVENKYLMEFENINKNVKDMVNDKNIMNKNIKETSEKINETINKLNELNKKINK